MTIAIDAMGGDFGPRVSVPAAVAALSQNSTLKLILFGDSEQIKSFYPQNISRDISSRLQIIHCSQVIDEKNEPLVAIRNSKDSSLYLALQALQQKEAKAVVSAANTAVLMGLSKIMLSMLDNFSRPALATQIPNINRLSDATNSSIMLDLGANIETNAEMLMQFATMGVIMAQATLKTNNPRVALLNIGTEQNKGTQVIRDTDILLKECSNINYIGFIEGHDLLTDTADVIVADGFSANIALKSMEGVIKIFYATLKQDINRHSLFGKLKLLIAKLTLKNFFANLTYLNADKYNGASLLGLNGIVIKSHGNAGIVAFQMAIEQAIMQVNFNLPNQIRNFQQIA